MVKKKAQEKSASTNEASRQPTDYGDILTDMTRLISESRRRATSTVNRDLVLLYWQIGAVILSQQQTADWGDSVVEQLATDLRAAFPDMKGLTRNNVFRMRQIAAAYIELDTWMPGGKISQPVSVKGVTKSHEKVATAPRLLGGDTENKSHNESLAWNRLRPNPGDSMSEKVATAPRLFPEMTIAATIRAEKLVRLISSLSWSHHMEIIGGCAPPEERYFYLAMSVAERWSVRELRRQIDSALFTRYVSVKDEPEKCLPDNAESGDLLPFKDHYVLEFLGLGEEHSERELRHAVLANLRDFFLEFGRDLTFVGEEYPLTVGNDTFRIDLLFFHRRLRCLIAVDLKIGKFKPEHVGKSLFYTAALDEQIRLDDENPSLGLVLCKAANSVQVRLALSAAAKKVGVATYQTALPDENLLRQRLEQLPALPEDFDQ